MSQPETDIADWDARVLRAHDSPHFMQSASWAQTRRSSPWAVTPHTFDLGRDYPAAIFERRADGHGVLQYIPRVSGLEPDDVTAFTRQVRAIASASNAFATKLEFYQPRNEALLAALTEQGWQACRAAQYRFGVTVDMDGSEEEIFAAMKKRARYEIRIAERNNVLVRQVQPTEANRERMLELVQAMAERSQAFIRTADYLERVWLTFTEQHGRLYFAEHDGNVVAGAFVIVYGTNAWYKDGGSLREHPQLMASRLLHWRIIQDLAAEGIRRYDLGNVPPPGEADAPGQGLLTFKGAYSRSVVEYMPALQLSHRDVAETWLRGENEFLREYRERTGDYWY